MEFYHGGVFLCFMGLVAVALLRTTGAVDIANGERVGACPARFEVRTGPDRSECNVDIDCQPYYYKCCPNERFIRLCVSPEPACKDGNRVDRSMTIQGSCYMNARRFCPADSGCEDAPPNASWRAACGCGNYAFEWTNIQRPRCDNGLEPARDSEGEYYWCWFNNARSCPEGTGCMTDNIGYQFCCPSSHPPTNTDCEHLISPLPNQQPIGDWSACGQLTCPPHYTCASTAANDAICCPVRGLDPNTFTAVPTPGPGVNTGGRCDLFCQEGYRPRPVSECCRPPYRPMNVGFHYECVPNVPTTEGPGDRCVNVACQHALCYGRFNPRAPCGYECLIRQQQMITPQPPEDCSFIGCPAGFPSCGAGSTHVDVAPPGSCCPQYVCVEIYSGICNMSIETSRCQAFFPRFAYHSGLKKCVSFIYGGCAEENRNRFITQSQCDFTCRPCFGLGGLQYHPGEYYTLPSDPCQTCLCGDYGQPGRCIRASCPPARCPPGQRLIRVPGSCCGFTCNGDGGGNSEHPDWYSVRCLAGTYFSHPLRPCEECLCGGDGQASPILPCRTVANCLVTARPFVCDRGTYVNIGPCYRCLCGDDRRLTQLCEKIVPCRL